MCVGVYKSVVRGLTGPLGDGTGPHMPDVPHNGRTQGHKHSAFCQLESAFSGQGKFKIQHRRHILAECPCPAERRVVSWPRREGSSTEDQQTQPPSVETRAAFSLWTVMSRVPLYKWTVTRVSRDVISSLDEALLLPRASRQAWRQV